MKSILSRAFGDPFGVSACGVLYLLMGAAFIAIGLVAGFGLAGVLLCFGLLCLFFGWLWI